MAGRRLRKFAEELLAVAPRFMPWYVPLPKAGKDGSDSGAAGELGAGSRAVSAAAEANAIAAARAKERALKERQSKGKDGKVRKLRSGKPSLLLMRWLNRANVPESVGVLHKAPGREPPFPGASERSINFFYSFLREAPEDYREHLRRKSTTAALPEPIRLRACSTDRLGPPLLIPACMPSAQAIRSWRASNCSSICTNTWCGHSWKSATTTSSSGSGSANGCKPSAHAALPTPYRPSWSSGRRTGSRCGPCRSPCRLRRRLRRRLHRRRRSCRRARAPTWVAPPRPTSPTAARQRTRWRTWTTPTRSATATPTSERVPLTSMRPRASRRPRRCTYSSSRPRSTSSCPRRGGPSTTIARSSLARPGTATCSMKR